MKDSGIVIPGIIVIETDAVNLTLCRTLKIELQHCIGCDVESLTCPTPGIVRYSGIKFALIFAAETGAMLVVAATITTLFLSGWAGPFADFIGWLWFLLKTLVIIFVFFWIRATYPRLRVDQIMALSWKFLLPLSLINLAATSVEVFILRSPEGVLTTIDLWIMAAINIPLGLVCILLFSNLVRDKAKVSPVRPATKLIPGVSTVEVR